MSAQAQSPHRVEGGYGPGSWVDTSFTPVPQECKRLLAMLARDTPGFTDDERLVESVSFEGDDLPNIPGPLKSQALVAAVHAMAGIVGHEILEIRGIPTDKKTMIQSSMGGLYPNTPGLISVDGVDGPAVLGLPTIPHLRPPPSVARDVDYDHWMAGNSLKLRSQGIYPTATEGMWYQLHGSTNPYAALKAIGIDQALVDADKTAKLTRDEAYEFVKERTMKYQAKELELIMIEQNVPGSIVYSPQAWRETIMGKSLAKHPLINYKKLESAPLTPPTLFASLQDKRPLAGVKVVELARIIALPATGAMLASFGAEVVRVQSKHLPDFSPGQLCLMQGKRSTHLDLDQEHDKQALKRLMEEADVILQGYRPESLTKRGVGIELALEIAARRGKGICWLDENCYGPDGVYRERRGWQQVADAASGCEYIMGKSLGLPDGQGILPSLPIADMTTGVVGAVTVMSMLRDRARFGGSYRGCASLTALQVLTASKEVGLYQPDIVQRIQDKYKFAPMTSDLHVIELYYAIYEAWKATSDLVSDEKYYTHFDDSVYGKDLRVLKPLVEYTDKAQTPHWTSPPVPFCHSADVAF